MTKSEKYSWKEVSYALGDTIEDVSDEFGIILTEALTIQSARHMLGQHTFNSQTFQRHT